VEPTSHFVEANGLRIHYLEWPGQGPPMVMVHPTGFLGRIWAPYADQLAPRYRVVAVDTRGHGDSSKPESGYGWDQQASDLEAIMDALGLRAALGVGHSAGATAIALAAAARPELFAKAVLIDPIISPRGETPATDAQPPRPNIAEATKKRRAIWDSRQQIYESFSPRFPFKDWRPEFLWAYINHGTRDLPAGQVELKCPPHLEAQMYTQNPGFDHFLHLRQVACPVLLLRGALTDRFPRAVAQRMEREMPHCRWVDVAGASHFVPMEKPDEVTALLLGFFQGAS